MKLLDYTLRRMLLYALIILALSIPAYFFIINYIWINELDKHHRVLHKRILQKLESSDLSEKELINTMKFWNHVGIYIRPAKRFKEESEYFINRRFDHDHQDFEQFRCYSTYIMIHEKPYKLLIETNMEEGEETIGVIAGITLVFFLFLSGGFVLLNRRLSKKIWSPFQDTLSQLRNFDLNNNQPVVLKSTKITELQELNTVLGKLLERNLTIYQQQKQFAENASHELQTPLALLQTKINLLEQSEDLTMEQSSLIENIQFALNRISRINKNLLLLAKIENQQFEDSESIPLQELMEQNIEFLDDYFQNKELELELSLQTDLRIKANRSLLEILLSNLLVNAIRHSPAHGRIKIHIQGRKLEISNPGNYPLSENQLFRRFASTSIQTPGSGLGLAIIKEICNRYGWEVQYEFRGEQHVFSIFFND